MAPSLFSLSLLLLVFVVSLLLAVGASAWFTRRLETISDLFDLSPGLLSLLGALGANIPNYVASLVAHISASRQRVSRLLGLLLVLVYITWVVVHAASAAHRWGV